MTADNVVLNPGVGGNTVRSFPSPTDGVSQIQVVQQSFGGEGGESQVTLGNPMPIQPAATYFQASAGNTSTTQLAAGAVFTGSIESVLSQTALSLIINTDQALSITVNQYVTSSALSIVSSYTYTITGAQDFSRSFVLNGNYANVVVTNLGPAPTTMLNINAYYGTIDSSTQLGNKPVAITEVGGVAIGGAVPVSFAGPVSTTDTNVAAATSSDAPIFTAITGDPSGDFAGVNLLEAAMDSTSGLGFNVQVQNPAKTDGRGAQIPSDAPAVVSGTGTNATTNSTLFVIDTTGYQSLTLQLYGTWAGTVTFYGSNDGANWSVTTASGVGAAAAVTTATANNLYTIPVMGRFFKAQITAYTSGTVQALAYLRQQSTIPMAAGSSVNLNQVGGASTITAGVSGLLAVGGNVAAGVAATANPVLVGGVDPSGSTRRLLLDAMGLLRVRQDIETQANESVVDLLTKILMELKLTNYRLGELPATLAQSTLTTTFAPPQTDDANVFLNDPQLLNQ